jgi:hypothetical protein
MHRGLPFRKVEGRWSGHSGKSSVASPSPTGFAGSSGWSWTSSRIIGSNSRRVTPSGTPIAWMHNKYHGCIKGSNMLGMKCISEIKNNNLIKLLYQYVQISSPVEKYLPNLSNLRYSCSSLVKALTPNKHKSDII